MLISFFVARLMVRGEQDASVQLRREVNRCLSDPESFLAAEFYPLRVLAQFANDGYALPTRFEQASCGFIDRLQNAGASLLCEELKILAQLFAWCHVETMQGGVLRDILTSNQGSGGEDDASWSFWGTELFTTIQALGVSFDPVAFVEATQAALQAADLIWQRCCKPR